MVIDSNKIKTDFSNYWWRDGWPFTSSSNKEKIEYLKLLL